MSVDERTRVDGEVDPVDPTTCFEEVLPDAFERERDAPRGGGGGVRAATADHRRGRRRLDARGRRRRRAGARRA